MMMRPPYNPEDDVYLKKYPQAKLLEGCTPGYGYEFGHYHIIKNITGTGGWILVMKNDDESKMHPYAFEFDEAVREAEGKLNV